MPGDPNSIGYTVFVNSGSGSWRLFGSLKDVHLELEKVEIMEWKMFSVLLVVVDVAW